MWSGDEQHQNPPGTCYMQIIEPTEPRPTESIFQGGAQHPVILMLVKAKESLL